MGRGEQGGKAGRRRAANSGHVTADLKPKGAPATTSQVGDAICEAL